jgi:molecular chaperone DnaK (HSP70)
MGNTHKIPSVISYSPAAGEGEQQTQQWGSSLSPDAVAMINTKLELDIQDDKADELGLLLQALDGMQNLTFRYVKDSKGHPDYTWLKPEDIAADYLRKVFTFMEDLISDYGPGTITRLHVDLVVTIPVVSNSKWLFHVKVADSSSKGWSYRAQDSTLRALRKAGFNNETFPLLQDTIMVTEPEAAAVHTARHLKEKLGGDFLKVSDHVEFGRACSQFRRSKRASSCAMRAVAPL